MTTGDEVHITVVIGALVLALTAAARSTWSPCGLSMLSTITPIGERGRGNRFRAAAGWFVVGGVLGGATLGGATALLAAGVARMHLSSTVLAALAAAAALVVAASDGRLGGFALPFHRRQVNELWLDQFRPWVYGIGFGFQIGCGLATYVITAGVYLLVALGALSGEPALAFALGVLFGTARGLAVLLGRRITSPAALAHFHRRFDVLGPRVRALVIAVELCVAGAAAGMLWPPAVGIAALAALPVWALYEHRRHPLPASYAAPAATPSRVADIENRVVDARIADAVVDAGTAGPAGDVGADADVLSARP